MPSMTGTVKRRASEPAGHSSENRVSMSAKANAALANGKVKTEQFDPDHEKFLAQLEKPTQIYRALYLRFLHSPFYLIRNLTYMMHRLSRKKKTNRKNFKVDDLLDLVKKKLGSEKHKQPSPTKPLYYNLIFIGFANGQTWAEGTMAKVEIHITRVCQKKRKDVKEQLVKAFGGFCQVRSYEDIKGIDTKQKCGVIQIPSDAINLVNGHIVKSYVLMVKVTLPKSALISHPHHENGDSIKENSSSNETDGGGGGVEEPRLKKRRSVPPSRDKDFLYLNEAEQFVFMGEFRIYDKELNIPLGNTDFEMILKQSNQRSRRANSLSFNRLKKAESTSWVVLDSNRQEVVDLFHKSDSERENNTKGRLKIAIRSSSKKLEENDLVGCPISMSSVKPENGVQKKEGTRIIYQFFYNNNSRQQTETRDDLKCPWCFLNCGILYSLLKHLKLCHPRFNFIYVPSQNGALIDVSINENFDGSYTGSAYDLVAQPPGRPFARDGPTKRTRVFALLVCKPRRLTQSLNEFIENNDVENDVEQIRTYITGHNRLYHHTTTSLPIHPREIDIDSEGENDPEWLRVKTSMMIDEFTDVNEGEKEIMKLWNLHMLKYNYVGDCQIPLACKHFVEKQGKELIQKNLYRNFILHLTNLFDFGLLSPQGVYQTVQLLHTQMKADNSAATLRESWKAQAKEKSENKDTATRPQRPSTSKVASLTNGVKTTPKNSTASIATLPATSENNSKS